MKQHKKTTKKPPDKGVDELLQMAEAPRKTTMERPEDSETAYRQRREHRLVPALPPITPASQW